MKWPARGSALAAWVLSAAFAAALLPALLDAATRGVPVADRAAASAYLRDGRTDTGAVNLVTAVLLDYRAFDTLGEATVIFAAAAIVGALLLARGTPRPRPPLSPLVRCAMQGLIPWFWVFPVAIILQGHLTPGGGFQGGVALAVLAILADTAFGTPTTASGVGERALGIAESMGALSFWALGLAGVLAGTGYLANLAAGFSAGSPGTLASGGVIPFLNVAIGCKVAAALVSMYRHIVREQEATP